MREIEVLETLTVGSGTMLRLNDKQARARAALLINPAGQTLAAELQKQAGDKVARKAPRDGVYQTTELTQFKRGEVFGMEGEVPKTARATVKIDGAAAVDATSQPSPAVNVRAPVPVSVRDDVFDGDAPMSGRGPVMSTGRRK